MDSISGFAESLILNEVNDITTGKATLPAPGGHNLAPAGRDITNVEVPSSFMKQVLGENFHPQDTQPTEVIPELVWSEPEEAPTPTVISEQTVQELIPLLQEVKGLLTEMMSAGATMSGDIGCNMAGSEKVSTSWAATEKEYGYITPKKSKTRKDVLKQSIRAKLKKKK